MTREHPILALRRALLESDSTLQRAFTRLKATPDDTRLWEQVFNLAKRYGKSIRLDGIEALLSVGLSSGAGPAPSGSFVVTNFEIVSGLGPRVELARPGSLRPVWGTSFRVLLRNTFSMSLTND